jgi:hypothetical protein
LSSPKNDRAEARLRLGSILSLNYALGKHYPFGPALREIGIRNIPSRHLVCRVVTFSLTVFHYNFETLFFAQYSHYPILYLQAGNTIKVLFIIRDQYQLA